MEIEPDWRLHATTTLAKDWLNPWSGQNVPTGTRVTVCSVMNLTSKKQLTISLPNATAILLSAANRSYQVAQKIRQESNIDKSIKHEVSFVDEKSSFDYIEAKIESVIMAFTALEAFANELIPDFYEYEHTKKDNEKEILNKEKIERTISLDEKLSVILPAILSVKSPKGLRCWEEYRSLKRTRDRLIHMKSNDRRSTTAENETLWHILFTQNAPHIVAKKVINHYVGSMAEKPLWHSKCPF
jgi:hypothetical protein